MARFTSKSKITKEAMRTYGEAVKRIGELHLQLAEAMNQSDIESLHVSHVKTGLRGLTNIGRFMGAATNAYTDSLASYGVAEIAGAVAELETMTKTLLSAHTSRDKRRKDG